MSLLALARIEESLSFAAIRLRLKGSRYWRVLFLGK